jgi:hypothetical protein
MRPIVFVRVLIVYNVLFIIAFVLVHVVLELF